MTPPPRETKTGAPVPKELGSQFTFLVGMESSSKLIVAHATGKRDGVMATEFISDLASRLSEECSAMLVTDGFAPYVEAVELAFGGDIDLAQLINTTTGTCTGDIWGGAGVHYQQLSSSVGSHSSVSHSPEPQLEMEAPWFEMCGTLLLVAFAAHQLEPQKLLISSVQAATPRPVVSMS